MDAVVRNGKQAVLQYALLILDNGQGLGDCALSVTMEYGREMADWLVLTLWRAGLLPDLFAHLWLGIF